MSGHYRFGPFVLDQQAFELRRNGRPLPVSASLLKLLTLFVEHPNELLTRDRIAVCLWEQPEYVDVSTGINTAINRLRAVLGESSSKVVYLQTVVGRGYRFVAPVQIEESPVQPKAERARPAGILMADPAPWFAEPAASRQPAALVHPAAVDPAEDDDSQTLLLLSQPATPSEIPGTAQIAPVLTGRAEVSTSLRWFIATAFGLLLIAGLLWHRRRVSHPVGQTSSAAIAPVAFVEVTYNDGDDPATAQSLSPDGQWIAYSDHHGLYVKELNSSLVRVLPMPTPFQVSRISWYFGGDALLVSGIDGDGGGSDHRGVWRVPLGDGEPQLLLRAAEGAVTSPDGKRLAYLAAKRTEIWIVDETGAVTRKLRVGLPGDLLASLVWAPTGDRLIYQRCQTPPPEEVTLNSLGQKQHRCDYESVNVTSGVLTASEQDVRFNAACLLPDGRLYFVRDPLSEESTRAALYLVRTDKDTGAFLGFPEFVSTLPGNSAIDLSATERGDLLGVLMERRASEVYVGEVRFPGPQLKRVRRLLHTAPDNYPHAWDADGASVLYESNDGGAYAIYKQKPDGSPAQLFARAPHSAVMPQLSPDKQWVLFEDVVWSPDPHAAGIFRAPVHGGPIQQILTHGLIEDFRCPVTNHSSETVNCTIRERTDRDMAYFVLDPSKGEGRKIVTIPRSDSVLGDWNVSNDGTEVAIANHDPDHPSIHFLRLGKSGPALPSLSVYLPHPGKLLSASWAPDGRGFYAQAKTGTGYELLFIDHHGRATLLRQTNVPTWGVPSPSGTQLAFVDQSSNTNVWVGAPGAHQP